MKLIKKAKKILQTVASEKQKNQMKAALIDNFN